MNLQRALVVFKLSCENGYRLHAEGETDCVGMHLAKRIWNVDDGYEMFKQELIITEISCW